MKRFLAVAVCVLLVFFNALPIYAYADAAPRIISETAVLIDAESGQVLYNKDMDKVMYPASTTKVLTGLLAVELGDMNDVLTASYEALIPVGSSSHIALAVDEQITLEQAMYAMSIESANDAANVIGEYISAKANKPLGQLMNERAKQAGAKNSNFVNASGLPDDNHYTTAYDLAMITRERVKYDLFNTIFSAETYAMPGTNLKSQERVFHSQNWYINGVTPCEGLVMSKVGWTEEAAHTMVTCCERDGLKLICVVMKSINRADKWKDTTALLDWAFSNYKRISFTGQYIALSADEEMSIDKKGRLYVKKSDLVCPDVSIFLTKGDDDRGIRFNFTNPDISEDLSTVTFDVEIYTGRWATKNVLATVKATAKVSERSAEYVATYARMSLLSDLAMVVIFGILTFTAAMISDVLLNKRI
ncbi:MAG: D-alanyl-D-alanine carboxypeptidase [Oscillospiraceae bacterium]|nr:D-alanyl-D-alanine carboxypeptidase [Oscillospiraceae bacterium]